MAFITGFWAFTRKPLINSNPQHTSFKSKLIDVYKSIVSYFMIAIVLVILMSALSVLIKHFFSIEISKNWNDGMKKIVKVHNPILVMTVIGPITEEILFRLWLSFKRSHLIISLTVICLVLIIKLNHASLYNINLSKALFYSLVLAVIGGMALFLILKLCRFGNFKNKYFHVFYWCSCIGFGLIHILNFAPLKPAIFWAYPFFILPQLVAGSFLGYLRVKNGFFWALLMHSLINLPIALIYFFKS